VLVPAGAGFSSEAALAAQAAARQQLRIVLQVRRQPGIDRIRFGVV
jgi:hypothetical protein